MDLRSTKKLKLSEENTIELPSSSAKTREESQQSTKSAKKSKVKGKSGGKKNNASSQKEKKSSSAAQGCSSSCVSINPNLIELEEGEEKPTSSTSKSSPSAEERDMDSDDEEYDSSGEDVEFAMKREDHDQNVEEEYPFVVLSSEELVQHMIDSIRDANVILQLQPTKLRTLLTHFGWDKEKLLEAYYDGDQEQLFKDAQVVNPSTRTLSTISVSNTAGAEECQICLIHTPSSMMFEMECGHGFCKPCWNEYLTTKIMEEGMGQTMACAAHGCPILVDDATALMLITDPKVKLKYQQLITYGFVQCNRLLKWCPKADCTNAIRVQWVDWRPVTCNCGSVFCFLCGNDRHDPVKCNYLKKWLKKCDDDSETSTWIEANTKECPKCNATIEKDGGCNHMVCKNQICKADFCWVCLGPWEPHRVSFYKCNRYDETEAKAARDAQEISRASLRRFLFYCTRYMNHMQSLKLEHKLYTSVKEKMEEMQQHAMSWVETQFLKKAVDILCQCRQTLMYTYVFAFYLIQNNQLMIFEDNQRDLESATEKLSEYLERDITLENLADIKQNVNDDYRYCESRRQVLLAHVYEGYEKEWWQYNAE